MLLYHLYNIEEIIISEIWAENLNSAMEIAKNNLKYMNGFYVKKANLSGKWLLY